MTGLGISLNAIHTPGESVGMSESSVTSEKKSQPQRAGRGRRPLTRKQRAVRAGRRRAYVKLFFVAHFVTYATVCTAVLLATGFRPFLIVAALWGIGIVLHFFAALIFPDLRRRLIDREVALEVQRSALRERRNLEDKHARSLHELSASIAHEIRNPITAAKSLVQQVGEDPTSAQSVGYARVALEELDRVERSIAHLLRFAREEELEIIAIDLHTVLESALETLRERIDSLGVHVTREIETDGRTRGDAERLRRVFINLIANALDALEEVATPSPCIEILAGDNLAGSELWVRVRDNGPGLTPEALAQVFSPFYTSKEAGTGLGLALAKKVIEVHGGSLEATSTPGSGAEFVVSLPRHDAEAVEG